MPDYLLDTTAIIDYLRDRDGVPELLGKLCLQGGLLCCCPINIVEVYAGMKDKEKVETDEFLNSLKCYETTCEISFIAGDLRRRHAKKGLTVCTSDALIAATAIKHRLMLVTNNSRRFPAEEITIQTYDRQ